MARSLNEIKAILDENKNLEGTSGYQRLVNVYNQRAFRPYKSFTSVAPPPSPPPEPDFLDQIEELIKGVPAGAITLGELGAIGAATLLEEENELAARKAIQETAAPLKEIFSADKGSEDIVGRKFGEALGSFAGLGITSLIPYAGLPLATGLAAGAGSGEASERARAAGATEEERSSAALKGVGVGLTELIPLYKLRSLREVLGDNVLLNGIERIKRAAAAGGFEGAQEAAAGILQNAIQKGYDPTQELINAEVAEEGGYGAAVGATVQTLLDLALPKTRTGETGGIEPDEDATTTGVEEEIRADTGFDDEAGEAGEAGEVGGVDQEGKPLVSQKEFNSRVKTLMEVRGITEEEAEIEANKLLSIKPSEKAVTETETGDAVAETGDAVAETGDAVTETGDAVTEQPDVDSKTVKEVNSSLNYATKNIGKLKDPNSSSRVKRNNRVRLTDRLNELEKQRSAFPEGELTTNINAVIKEGDEVLTSIGSPRTKLGAEKRGKEEGEEQVQESTPAFAVNLKGVSSFTTIPDENKIKALKDENKPKKVSDREKAFEYFDKPGRTEEAIERLAFDYASANVGSDLVKGKEYKGDKTVPKEVKEFFARTGGDNAIKTYDWVKNNLSEKVNTKLNERVEYYTEEIKKQSDLPKRNLLESYAKGDTKVIPSKDIEYYDITEQELQEATGEKVENILDRYGSLETESISKEEIELYGITPVQLQKAKKRRKENIASQKATVKEQKRKDKEIAPSKTKSKTKKQIKEEQRRRKREAEQAEAGAAEAFVKTELSQARRDVLDPLDKKIKALEEKIAKEPTEQKLTDKKTKTILDRYETLDRLKKRKQAILRAGSIDIFEEGQYGVETEAQIDRELSRDEIAAGIQTEGYLRGPRLGFTPVKLAIYDSSQSLNSDIDNTAIDAFQSNNLTAGLEIMASAAPNKYLRNTSKRFVKPAQGTQIEIVDSLTLNGKDVSGLFDPSTNTIKLDSVLGLNYHTVLHEISHAVGSAELSNPKSAFTKRMTNLFNDTKDMLGSAYGSVNVQEFFAEGMSNESFRQNLARINPKGSPISALTRFTANVQRLLNRILGRNVLKDKTALTEFDILIDDIISPAPKKREAEMLAMAADPDGVERVATTAGTIWRQVRQSPFDTQGRRKLADAGLEFLIDVPTNVGNFMLGLRDLQAVGDLARKYFGDLGEQLHTIAKEQRGAMNRSDENVDVVVNALSRYHKTQGVEKYTKLAKTIYDGEYGATVHQIDPDISNSEGLARYGGSKDRYKRWLKLRKEWKSLGKEGQDMYRLMRNLYRKQYLELRDLLYDRIADVAGKQEAERVSKNVFKEIFNKNLLDVYFPLAREGRYKIRYYTKPISGPNVKLPVEVYNMEMVDTKAEALRIVEELRADEDVVSVEDPIDSKTDDKSYMGKQPSVGFVNEILAALDKGLAPKKDVVETSAQRSMREQIKKQVIDTFVNTLPETSFTRSLQRRQTIRGFKEDPMVALRTKAYDLGRQTVKLRYSKRVQDLENKLIEKYKLKQDTLNRSYIGDSSTQVYQELLRRAQFIRNPPKDVWAQTLNQGAFIYTIGFNASSAIVNLSQIPLFVMPYLGGIYGYKKTVPAIHKAYAIVSSSFKDLDVGIDNYYKRDYAGNYTLDPAKAKNLSVDQKKTLKDMETLVTVAAGEGQLTKSYLIDTLGLQKEAMKSGRVRSGNTARQALDWVTGVSATMFNVAERLNRQTALVTTYNLALDAISKGKKDFKFSEEQKVAAANKAIEQTIETNGGSFLETAPRLSQEGLGRVALMYKNFGLRMYQTMFNSAEKVIGRAELSSDPEENKRLRREGFKQLLGFHGTALFFAGAQGIPIYGAVSMIVDAWRDDDEEDFDTLVRDAIGEGWYKGALNKFLDVDVATRIRLTGLLIQDNRYNTQPSPEEFIGFYLGGPALSTGKRMQRGIKDLYEGEIERGMESLLPAGIANFWKANPLLSGRYVREGIITRRGDPIYDDLTGGELAAQMFGFAPDEYTRRQEENMILKKIDRTINEDRTEILKKYYLAIRLGNGNDIAEATKEIQKFNTKHSEYYIDPSAILRSLKSHMRSTAQMHNGIILSPAMRRLMNLEGELYY
jgi:hypothetical protein